MAMVQRVLQEALTPLGVRLSGAELHDLAAGISAGKPVALPGAQWPNMPHGELHVRGPLSIRSGRVIATMTLSINRKDRVLPPFSAARPIKERLMAAPMSSR